MPNSPKTLLRLMICGTAIGAVMFTAAMIAAPVGALGLIGYKLFKRE